MTQDAHLHPAARGDRQPPGRTPHGATADLLRRAEALDARVAAESAPRAVRSAGLIAVGTALTVVLALLGRQAWQLPHRGPGGVTDVPQSLLTFLLLCAAGCVWAAGRSARPAETLRVARCRPTCGGRCWPARPSCR